jgi:hypothetical protein
MTMWRKRGYLVLSQLVFVSRVLAQVHVAYIGGLTAQAGQHNKFLFLLSQSLIINVDDLAFHFVHRPQPFATKDTSR